MNKRTINNMFLAYNTAAALQNAGITVLLHKTGHIYTSCAYAAATLVLIFAYLAIVREELRFYRNVTLGTVLLSTTIGIVLFGWEGIQSNYIMMCVLMLFISYITKSANVGNGYFIEWKGMLSMGCYMGMYLLYNKPALTPLFDTENTFLIMSLTVATNTIFIYGFLYYIVRSSKKTRKNILDKAQNDALTKLPNRYALEDYYNKAQKEQRKIACVAIADIDHFKKVNDTYGHNVGDEVLVKVSKILQRKTKRTAASVFRWGGEEFVLAIQYMPTEEIKKLLESIREEIEVTSFECEGAVLNNVTITIGAYITTAEDTDKNLDGLIEKADKNLYTGKETGRNRVVIS